MYISKDLNFYHSDIAAMESEKAREQMGDIIEELGVAVLPDASPSTRYVCLQKKKCMKLTMFVRRLYPTDKNHFDIQL